MDKKSKELKSKLKAQNEFLKGLLKSIEDVKKGRVHKFDFSE